MNTYRNHDSLVLDFVKSGKPLFLTLPDDIREVLRHARYLEIFEGSGVRIVVHATQLQRQVLTMTSAELIYVDAPPACDATTWYGLAKLSYFATAQAAAPYLAVPTHCKKAVAARIPRTDRVKVALCLDSFEELPAGIFSAFTVHQLMNMEFYLFSSTVEKVAAHMPIRTSFVPVPVEEGLQVSAAWLEQMHIVIAEENMYAHLAGALGKPVWLIASTNTNESRIKQFVNDYPEVAVSLWTTSRLEALQKISLSLYFNVASAFTSFTTELARDINIDVPRLSSRQIDNVNDISLVLEELYACLTNVAVETTTLCNLRCPYCPNSTVGRKPAFMEAAVYRKVIDSLAEYLPDYSGTLSPHFYGEPLLDERLEELVRYSRERLPGAVIEVYTNGEFLYLDRFIALKSAGVDLFRISQHTEEPSVVIQETLTTLKKKYPELFTVEYKMFSKSSNKSNRGGLVEGDPVDDNAMRQVAACSIAHRLLTFDYMGNAVLCCNDYLSEYTFGNIMESSVKEIWESSHYRKIRNQLMFGYLPYDICKKCFCFMRN